jgi:hypothetical protein
MRRTRERRLPDGRSVPVHRNGGLRKLCACAVRVWPKCPHPWHFNFCHGKDVHGRKRYYRFSLDKYVGRRITTKGEAETEAERIHLAIRAGQFNGSRPDVHLAAGSVTVRSYADQWLRTVNGRLKASTVGFYKDNLSHHVLPLLGHWAISGINRSDCIQLITALRGKKLRIPTVRCSPDLEHGPDTGGGRRPDRQQPGPQRAELLEAGRRGSDEHRPVRRR